KRQILEKENTLPNAIFACIGGGSNAIGAFYDFIEDQLVDLYGVEAEGKKNDPNMTGASLNLGTNGVFHGAHIKVLQDKYGQIKTSYSVSAGLDYPGVGPEHCFLKEIKRLKTGMATDEEALSAFNLLSKTEGIIPALEPAHALAYLVKVADQFDSNDIIVVNLSGHGGKDLGIIQKYMGDL
ncbi:MAG: pyridoxal-phosphate dependent enzyme, partial [Candidatus Helarchaeota archaeon]|nr:pyridoxal-phosphate dependent enzyme [Candidatus Helarchaeota archaeon]